MAVPPLCVVVFRIHWSCSDLSYHEKQHVSDLSLAPSKEASSWKSLLSFLNSVLEDKSVVKDFSINTRYKEQSGIYALDVKTIGIFE